MFCCTVRCPSDEASEYIHIYNASDSDNQIRSMNILQKCYHFSYIYAWARLLNIKHFYLESKITKMAM